MKNDAMENEEIIVMTKEQWEEYHIQVARGEARARQNRWNAKHEAERQERLYYCRKTFTGLIVVTVGLGLLAVSGNLLSLGFCAVGVYTMVTKEKICVY